MYCKLTAEGETLTCEICGRSRYMPAWEFALNGNDPSKVHWPCHLNALPVFGPPKPPPAPPPPGAGTKLKELFHSLGITPHSSCGCDALAARMDRWGVEGCRGEHRDAIIAFMHNAYDTLSWLECRTAEVMAVKTRLILKINWCDPIPSLLDEAIRRAAAETEGTPV